MQQIPQPVVAQVHGLATAAGCQLVASADLAVASEEAGFATPGGKGGWFCHTPMVAVARNVGRKRATELALSGDTIDAATALDWGLVNRVVPAAQLGSATRDLLDRVTRGSAESKGIGKQALYAQIDLDQPKAYAYAIEVMAATSQIPDAREGMRVVPGEAQAALAPRPLGGQPGQELARSTTTRSTVPRPTTVPQLNRLDRERYPLPVHPCQRAVTDPHPDRAGGGVLGPHAGPDRRLPRIRAPVQRLAPWPPGPAPATAGCPAPARRRCPAPPPCPAARSRP